MASELVVITGRRPARNQAMIAIANAANSVAAIVYWSAGRIRASTWTSAGSTNSTPLPSRAASERTSAICRSIWSIVFWPPLSATRRSRSIRNAAMVASARFGDVLFGEDEVRRDHLVTDQQRPLLSESVVQSMRTSALDVVPVDTTSSIDSAVSALGSSLSSTSRRQPRASSRWVSIEIHHRLVHGGGVGELGALAGVAGEVGRCARPVAEHRRAARVGEEQRGGGGVGAAAWRGRRVPPAGRSRS